MYEAFYIANLFYDLNETSKHQNDKSFYILSTSWFEKWKKYVYNIDEKYIYGRDYLIVTRDIWKFFQCIYGGKEIRRYNLNRELYNTTTN